MKQIIQNCECGLLRAKFTAQEKYFKRLMNHFFYNGDYLYHYTDLNGLIGIVQNRGFWLSEAKYLNDSEELYNGVNLSIEIIDKLISKNRYSIFRKILSETIDELRALRFKNNFVAAFSMSRDSLEQWRAYGKNGSGICIGFNIKIKTDYPHFQIPPQYMLQKVIYDDNIKKYIIMHILSKYFLEFKDDLKRGIDLHEDDYPGINIKFFSV